MAQWPVQVWLAWRSQVLKIVPCAGRTLRPLRLCADDDDDDEYTVHTVA